jgi:hypothetical protein
MNLIESIEFIEFDPEVLESYSCEKSAAIDLTIPDAYLSSVLENLAALQTHAAILAARFKVADPQTSRIARP